MYSACLVSIISLSYEVAYDQWRRDQEERDKLLNDSQASALSMPPDTPPPTLLPEFDEETARKKLNEEYFATRRHPGQPVLTPELYLNMPLSGQIQEQREVNRRREVDKLSYFIRVKINGETACETKHRKLKQDFIIDFQVGGNGMYSRTLLVDPSKHFGIRRTNSY